MNKDNYKIKLSEEENTLDALSCLENSKINPIAIEVFDIAKLLAKVAVEQFFIDKNN